MSGWTGIAAAGVAIVMAFGVAVEPIWMWQFETVQSNPYDTWSYGLFSVHHVVVNRTTGRMETDRTYEYAALATLPSGPPQPKLARAFQDFSTFFLLGLLAAFGGLALGIMTVWKKLRGIFAGAAFLAGCASILYATLIMTLTIPVAATADLSSSLNFRFSEIRGSATAAGLTYLVTWTPYIGWGLALVAGLGFAWAASDFWHLMPKRKETPMKFEVVLKQAAPALAPPPARIETAPQVAEPDIEEVFVIGSNGLLIKHMSHSLMTDKDRDVVGSMISAISSFIREAFSERDGEVHEVTLGDHRFVMCNDSGLVAAVLVTSGDTQDVVHRLMHLLAVLRDRYGNRLANWQGEPLEGIEDELAVLWDPYHLPPPPVE
ncbi:MAG: roadblock/LC7 domain-containing protein [Thermoplasmata archaeon]|nr:roadblock/LC7 domain-containing protein [Thermoplasmata archaeon]